MRMRALAIGVVLLGCLASLPSAPGLWAATTLPSSLGDQEFWTLTGQLSG